MKLEYAKIRNVKSPCQGTKKSAGIDFFVPMFDKKFIKDFIAKNGPPINICHIEKNKIVVPSNNRVFIPLGIRVNLSINTALIVYNKSGISLKKGLDKLAEVIDEDYQGEINIILQNSTQNNIEIFENEKIIQFILQSVHYPKLIELNEQSLYKEKTRRSEHGFGSTDN